MFEFRYSAVKSPFRLYKGNGNDSKTFVVPIIWTEHCIECAAPTCYATCPRFKAREDGNCIRIKNGITPVKFDKKTGARIFFLPWSKIEGWYTTRSISMSKNGRLYSLINFTGKIVSLFTRYSPKKLAKFLNNGWYSVRQRILNNSGKPIPESDRLYLYFEIYNEDRESTILVDIKTGKQLLFRECVTVPMGLSKKELFLPVHSTPAEQLFINIHPGEADAQLCLDFKTLDIIPLPAYEGKKIKLVIWDLDNTLWKGIFVEDKQVEIRKDFIALIKELDSKGIVNSIASKNDKTNVWPYLEKIGISEYFVFPKINWNPKSASISQTISQMNINPNTVVFVDDNPVERDEIKTKLPSVTCVDPSEILPLCKSERFNVTVTPDSIKRRSTYKMLEAMKQDEDEWTGGIDDFIRQCNIVVNLDLPNENNIMRCYELLQRTNQLNSSGRRIPYETLCEMVSNDIVNDCYTISAKDKYGDYGLVGFMIVDKTKDFTITDFVISCRVANRKIEPTIINCLANRYNGQIQFLFKKTDLNGPMKKTIHELDMDLIESKGDFETYKHISTENENFITVIDNTQKQ